MSFVGTSEAEGETSTPPLVSTPGPSSNLFSTLWPTACTGANHYTPNPPRFGRTHNSIYPAGALPPERGPRACAKKPATPELSFDATVQDADGALRGIADSLLDLQQSLEELEKASSIKAACHPSASLRASPHALSSPSASISVPLTSWSSSPHHAGCDNSASVDVLQVKQNLQSVVQDKIRAVDEHLSVVTLDLKLLDRLLTNKLRHLPPPTLKEREGELRDVAEKFTAVDAEFRSLEKQFLLLKAKTSADSPALRKREAAGTSSVSEPNRGNRAGPTRAQTLFQRLENRRLEREQREQSKEAAAPAKEEDRLVAREQNEEKDHDDEMFGGGSRRVFSVFSPARFEEYGDLVHDNLSPESLTAHTPMTVADRLQPPLSGRGHGGGHGKTSPEQEQHPPESELKPRGNILSGNALSEGEELPEDADPARAPLRADRLRFLSSLANSQSASECSSSPGEVQLEDANADEHEASILEQQWEVEEDAESLVRMQRTLGTPSGGDRDGGQRGGSRAIGEETKKVNQYQHAWDNDNLASTVDAAEDDRSGATYSSSSAMQTGDEADDHEGRTHKDDHEKKLHEHGAAGAEVLRSAFSVPYCSSGGSTIIGGHATASDIENEVVATPAAARDRFEDAVDDAGAEAEADGCSPLTPSSIARGEEQFFPAQCFPVVPTAARPADGPAAPRPKLEHEKQIERTSATTPEEQLVQTLTNLPEMLESRVEGVGLGLEKLQGSLSSGLERAKKKVASGSDGLLHTMADGLTKGLLFVSTAGEADEAEVHVASTTVPPSPAPDQAEVKERSVSQATSTTAATATATTAYGYDSSLPLVEAAQKAEDEMFRREVLSPTRKNTGKLFRSPSRTDHVRGAEGGFGLMGSVGKGNTPKCLEDDDDHRPEKKPKYNYTTSARDILAAATRNEDLSGAKHHDFSPTGMQQSPLSSFHGTPVVHQPLLRMLKEEHRGNEMNSDNAPEETPSPGHRSSVPLSAKRFIGGPASKAERRTADTRRSPHTADRTFTARPGAPSSSSSSKAPLLQNYSPSPKHNKTTRTRTVTGFSPGRSANKRGSPLSAQLGGSSDRKSRASGSRNKSSSRRGHVAIEDDDHPDERHLKKLPNDLVQIELASMRLQQQNKDLHELDRLTDKLECQAREIKRELSEQADLMNDLEHGHHGGAGDIGAAFAADSRGANFDAERTSTRNFSFASSGNMMIPSLRDLQDTMSGQIHRMQRWLEDRSAENEAEEWTCLWISQMAVARFVVDENNQPHTLRMLCGVFVMSSILLLRAYVL